MYSITTSTFIVQLKTKKKKEIKKKICHVLFQKEKARNWSQTKHRSKSWTVM